MWTLGHLSPTCQPTWAWPRLAASTSPSWVAQPRPSDQGTRGRPAVCWQRRHPPLTDTPSSTRAAGEDGLRVHLVRPPGGVADPDAADPLHLHGPGPRGHHGLLTEGHPDGHQVPSDLQSVSHPGPDLCPRDEAPPPGLTPHQTGPTAAPPLPAPCLPGRYLIRGPWEAVLSSILGAERWKGSHSSTHGSRGEASFKVVLSR